MYVIWSKFVRNLLSMLLGKKSLNEKSGATCLIISSVGSSGIYEYSLVSLFNVKLKACPVKML